MTPAAILLMLMGMKWGETRSQPRLWPRLCSSSITGRPPMPEETSVPHRSISVLSGVMPLWANASWAAMRPSWVNRAIFLASARGIWVSTSSPFTWAASVTFWPVVS